MSASDAASAHAGSKRPRQASSTLLASVAMYGDEEEEAGSADDDA